MQRSQLWSTLEHFERFVFILSVREHYSDRDCSEFLSCSPEELAQARMRALEQIRPRDRSPYEAYQMES
jgi:hypothetical protein